MVKTMNLKEKVFEILDSCRGESVSGAELAKKLNVSRNSVWKAVKSLQDEGFAIEAVTNKGYCLLNDNDVLNVKCIQKYLPDKYQNVDIEVYKSIDSTNLKAKEYGAAGRKEVAVIVSESQTAGRGRKGRSFYSPDMSGVYISFLFRPKFSVSQSMYLTTAAAVAAARTIEEVSGYKTGIKWVNDVFCHNKKVCGILTEAALNVENGSLDYAVTGIGFNIKEPKGGFPEEIKDIAGAIFVGDTDTNGKSETDIRSRIAAGMIQHFLEYYERLTERTYMDEYKMRSFLIGKEIYTLSEPPIYGTAIGIDDEAHLILRTYDGNEIVLSSGEVSVRLQ